MVAPAVTHRETLSTDLTRALARAKAEGIVVYRRDTDSLGVATMVAGAWTRKPYVLTISGPCCGDLTCSCPAGSKGTTCKHLAAGLFARKHHVYAVCPVAVAIPGFAAAVAANVAGIAAAVARGVSPLEDALS